MLESDMEKLNEALKTMQSFCRDEGASGGCADCPMYIHFCLNGECPKVTLERIAKRQEQSWDTCSHVKTGKTKLGFDITYCDICGPLTRCYYDECEDYEEKTNDKAYEEEKENKT